MFLLCCRPHGKKAQSVVELALVLPLLLAVILGMVEFGWVLNGKITLTSAAREGARVAIIYESAEQASNAVAAAVARSAESSSLINLQTTTVFNNFTRNAIVTVHAKIIPIVGMFFSQPVDLVAKAEMLVE